MIAVMLVVATVLVAAVAAVGYARRLWLLHDAASLDPVTEPGVVTFTVTLDTRPFVKAMGEAAAAMRQFGESLNRPFAVNAMVRLDEDIRWKQWLHRQRLLARASAVIGVRAGLDPAYRDRAALHALVREITADAGAWSRFTREERLELAVAAIRGWTTGWGRSEPRPELATARSYGDTVISTIITP